MTAIFRKDFRIEKCDYFTFPTIERPKFVKRLLWIIVWNRASLISNLQ
jgi:hypothetical protein